MLHNFSVELIELGGTDWVRSNDNGYSTRYSIFKYSLQLHSQKKGLVCLIEYVKFIMELEYIVGYINRNWIFHAEYKRHIRILHITLK